MSLVAELDRQRLGPQPPALARVAGARDQEAAEIVVADRALVVVGVVGVVASVDALRRPSRRARAAGRCRRSVLAPLLRRGPRLAVGVLRRAEEDARCAAPRAASPTACRDRRRAPRRRAATSVGERDASRVGPRRATAPSRSVRAGRRRRARDRSPVRAPRPSQAGQAPCGPLNENMRGSMGGSEMPQSTQAKRSLIQNGSSPSRRGRRAGVPRRA